MLWGLCFDAGVRNSHSKGSWDFIVSETQAVTLNPEPLNPKPQTHDPKP